MQKTEDFQGKKLFGQCNWLGMLNVTLNKAQLLDYCSVQFSPEWTHGGHLRRKIGKVEKVWNTKLKFLKIIFIQKAL